VSVFLGVGLCERERQARDKQRQGLARGSRTPKPRDERMVPAGARIHSARRLYTKRVTYTALKSTISLGCLRTHLSKVGRDLGAPVQTCIRVAPAHSRLGRCTHPPRREDQCQNEFHSHMSSSNDLERHCRLCRSLHFHLWTAFWLAASAHVRQPTPVKPKF
jgi:hypothetical protein